jgi:hypothetical protein
MQRKKSALGPLDAQRPLEAVAVAEEAALLDAPHPLVKAAVLAPDPREEGIAPPLPMIHSIADSTERTEDAENEFVLGRPLSEIGAFSAISGSVIKKSASNLNPVFTTSLQLPDILRAQISPDGQYHWR